MANILLSAAVRHNVLQLQGIDRLLKATETRLTSGKRVATPSDNPAAFFTASSLSQRPGDLNQLLDDFGNKLQMLKAADAAVNSIIALVQSGEADLNAALASTAPRPTATGNIIVSDQSDVTNLAGVSDGDQSISRWVRPER